jgi:hypothetical protein
MKNAVRSFSKLHAPSTVTYYQKKALPGQQSLFPSSSNLSWKLETSKLVELTAALSECNAFGEGVTRTEMWKFFSTTFNVSLTNAEKVLSQMKYRKNTPTRFLEELQDRFEHHMDGE